MTNKSFWSLGLLWCETKSTLGILNEIIYLRVAEELVNQWPFEACPVFFVWFSFTFFTILSLLIMYVFSKIWLEITPTGSSCLFQWWLYSTSNNTHTHTKNVQLSSNVMNYLYLYSLKVTSEKRKALSVQQISPFTSVLFGGCYGSVPAIQSRSMSQISSCTFGRQRGTRWYLFCRWTWRCQVVYRGRCRRKKPPLWSGRCHRNPHPRWTSGWWRCGVSCGW